MRRASGNETTNHPFLQSRAGHFKRYGINRLLLKTFLVVSTLFLYSVSSAQTSTLDSLKVALAEQKNDTVKLGTLNKIIDAYFNYDLEKALEYSQKAVYLADKTNAEKWQPVFHETLGRMYANMLELDSAVYYFQKAEKAYQRLHNRKGQATTYFKMGWVHKKRGELQEALQADLAALRLMEEIEDPLGIAGAYERLSEDVRLQGRHEDALVYARKAIETSEENNLEEELVYSYTVAGDACIAIEDYQMAFAYFDMALNLAKKLGFGSIDLSGFTNNRGNALKRLGNYEEALTDYEEAKRLAVEANYQNALNSVSANIGEVHLLMGNYEKALPYQLETIRLQEQHGDLPNLPENYMHISTIYENLGDYPAALEYQKKARIMGDSLAAAESDRTMSELLTQYETEKKEATIRSQNEEIAQQRKMQLLYISLAILLAILVSGMFFVLKNIRKKRAELSVLNTELDARNKQNELLLKEIHHRVKNNLELVKSLISLQSAKLSDAAAREAMLESQNRVQSMGIIHQKLYQGTNLRTIEMKSYFLNLGEGLLDTFQAEDQVKIEYAMEELELDVDTAVPIGLIVNELLTNALKYAFPERINGKISISLSQKQDNLQLKVADNGIGKAEGLQPKGTGFGSQLITLLTQQLRGTVIEENQKGTVLFFNFKIFNAA